MKHPQFSFDLMDHFHNQNNRNQHFHIQSPTTMHLLDVLKNAARKQQTYSYKELIEIGNLPYDLYSSADRKALGDELGEISAHCHYQGAPLISALVIDKQKNQPGLGFFRLAENLGRYDGSTIKTKQEAFWIQELNEVFSFKW